MEFIYFFFVGRKLVILCRMYNVHVHVCTCIYVALELSMIVEGMEESVMSSTVQEWSWVELHTNIP